MGRTVTISKSAFSDFTSEIQTMGRPPWRHRLLLYDSRARPTLYKSRDRCKWNQIIRAQRWSNPWLAMNYDARVARFVGYIKNGSRDFFYRKIYVQCKQCYAYTSEVCSAVLARYLAKVGQPTRTTHCEAAATVWHWRSPAAEGDLASHHGSPQYPPAGQPQLINYYTFISLYVVFRKTSDYQSVSGPHRIHEMRIMAIDVPLALVSVCHAASLWETAERIDILFRVKIPGYPRNIALDGGLRTPMAKGERFDAAFAELLRPLVISRWSHIKHVKTDS